MGICRVLIGATSGVRFSKADREAEHPAGSPPRSESFFVVKRDAAGQAGPGSKVSC